MNEVTIWNTVLSDGFLVTIILEMERVLQMLSRVIQFFVELAIKKDKDIKFAFLERKKLHGCEKWKK